ncbi:MULTISPECIES: amino acid adenylation domain-containing protein [Streptomyces]|uniref:amino acid adenylation domain-containing protein n=1 Tax=Streptomyces TaxID=1883 RepID=UPI00068F2CE5|nr:amino acid adenylation domain-containing protein [Streptomyces durhamensis]
MNALERDAATPPAGLLTDLIEARAAAAPEAVAVIADGRASTYRELDHRANRIARRLIQLGAAADVPIGVCLPRGRDLLPALLGVWKAGAAYLPLDTALPVQRLEYMLADSGAPVVICSSRSAERIPPGYRGAVLALDDDRADIEAQPPVAPDRHTGPEQLAYLMYTSGSTGTPKGVMVRQRALVNLVSSILDDAGAGHGGTWLASTSVSFDISGVEMYAPLASGGRVVLASDAEAKDPMALLRLMDAHGVTDVQATPSGWRLLLACGFDRPAVRALVGGEALPVKLAAELRRRAAKVTNVYGPTETTIWSMFWGVPEEPDRVLLGRPLARTQAYVLDSTGRPVPDDGTGELYLGGEGLARGYANRPGLTAERFVPNPFGAPGTRLYRTGDLVRQASGYTIEFMSRIDDQVKIRGYRIELGEIQARLIEHSDVRDAVVTVRSSEDGDKRLVAYLVPTPGRRPDVADIRAHLAATLPDYMIPPTFMAIGRIPLNTSGKTDYRALPDPGRRARRPAGTGR